MNLNKATPLMYTRQLKETVDWYVEVLGFSCTDFVPAWSFARVQLNGADVMIVLPNEHIPFDKPHFTGSFYINTNNANNADAWWEKLKDKCKVATRLKHLTMNEGVWSI